LLMAESNGVVPRARQQVADSLEYVEQLKRFLLEEGLALVEVERAQQPALSFHTHLREELEQAEGIDNS